MYKRSQYKPGSKVPFKVSRSKIDLFLECPKCFYYDRRLGVSRPSMPGWSLNSAVDTLLKNEFDILRKEKKPHELMMKYKIDAIPFQHPELNNWRENFVGIQYLQEKTNLIITGAIDDVWINNDEELLIVDYKSTSTEKQISLDDKYKQGYKRQMEIYQWIFRQKGFDVSSTGYFVFANAWKNRPKFDGKLEFAMTIVPYEGDSEWVENVLFTLKECLESSTIPVSSMTCEYCMFVSGRDKINPTPMLF